MTVSEDRLKKDPRIDRLLKNPNWKPAADAAIDYFFRAKECPIQSWRRSSTWAQVKMVFEEMGGSP